MEHSQPVRLSRLGFVALGLTVFAIAYNVAVLPSIMPAIVSDFNSSAGFIQSILVLFFLVTASFSPTTENLCRMYGRTNVFLVALAIYAVGIGIAIFSVSMTMLAVSFLLFMAIAATSLISTPWTIADLAQTGTTQQYANVVLLTSTALGNFSGALLGGFLASQFGWRWAFVPSLAVVVTILWFRRGIPSLTYRSPAPIDWVGGFLSFVGLGSILFGISLAGEFGWWQPLREFSVAGVVLPPFAISIVPTLISVGVIAMGLLLFWQRRRVALGQPSFLRIGLLRKPIFLYGMIAAMTHTIVTTGVLFNLFQFVPVALGFNPFRTALTIVPYNATVVVALLVASRLLALGDRVAPKYIVYAGIGLFAVGIAVLYWGLHPGMSAFDLTPGLITMGTGSGMFLAYISSLTYAGASASEKPEGSGIYNPVQNLGNSLGRGVLGTALVFFASRNIVDNVSQRLGEQLSPAERNRVVFELQEMIQTLPREDVQAAIVARLPHAVQPFFKAIELEAALSGIHRSLLLGLSLMAVCFLLARQLPKYPAPERTQSE